MTPATGSARRTLRQALTVARRDFTATVLTPFFLLFLFAPVLMGSFGALGGLGAAGAVGGSARSRVVAIVPDTLARPIAEADTRMRGIFRDPDDAPPPLATLHPAGDPLAQARAAFASADFDATAVMFGPLDHPHILVAPTAARSADWLTTLAGATLATRALGPPAEAVRITLAAPHPSARGRNGSAFFAVFGVFILTLLLSSPVIGSMTEERNNKVIEILAAAVPLEAVFFGKLIGMFGIALVFVAFWGVLLTGIGSLMPPTLAQGLAELRPATGAAFPLLFFAYFTMAYMLMGAVYLGIGAQATSTREVQLLSLPITILQIGVFGLSTAAASHPGSRLALAAELFPLSSPSAMAGHAAGQPQLWPHVAALAWEALWVALAIGIGARAFRRGVLQSGSARPRWLRRRPDAMPDNVG